ncbi:MAG: mitochondrial ribosomal protein S25-domain-containing protein [Olpidium bornovanus]|uniref:Small ribosomal subunit protein mS23 n=1 Tax=Olpidium bornovanus TaxID=278681 RepID=A0A8H8DM06_9FUNG|nr:MAG: mitochondrial ribosomal protein S25-domain-containing protein [Olpidium bornovanus]
MRFVFESTARDMPYVVARAVNVNRMMRPPPWLVAAKRVPPAPSVTYRRREWNDVGGTAEWEKEEREEDVRQAEYQRRKQAAQAAKPDRTAAGWTAAYAPAVKVRPHRAFRREVLEKRETAYRKYVPVIEYPEDELRRQFYENHPFELLRPSTMVEKDGLNVRDWSRLDGGVDAPLTGESVINHQHYLTRAEKMSPPEAYHRVVSELYKSRAREEVAIRVAEEQAIHHGAITNPGNYNTLDDALQNEDIAIKESYAYMDTIAQSYVFSPFLRGLGRGVCALC